MKKKVLLFLLVNLLLIVGISNAKADSVGNITQGDYLYYNGSSVQYTGNQGTAESGTSAGSYNWFRYKYDTTNNGLAYICHSGNITPPFNVSCQYKQSASDAKTSLGAAYIIRQIFGTVDGVSYNNYTSNFAKYYWAEITELAYLQATGSSYYLNMYGNIKVTSSKTMNQLVSEAETYATKYYNKPLTITLSPSSFTFSLDSAGTNYVSNKVYIKDTNGNADSIQVTQTGSSSLFKFTDSTDSGGRYVQYSIPKSSFSGSLTVGISVKASNSYNKIRVYNCGANVQEVSSTKLDTVSDSKTVTASGTVKNEKGKLTVKKVDASGNALAGAQLQVSCPKSNINTSFTTTTNDRVFTDLEVGDVCTVTELSAPDKYVKITSTVTATVTASGATATVTNKKNKVSFSKLNSSGAYISGAKLEIRTNASDANTVQSFCGGTCRWNSGASKKTFEGIPAGTYYLVETEAPAGYILASPKKFTVSANSTTEEVSVTMTNDKNELYISKQSLTDKKILPGATLEIRDASCTVVQNFCQEGSSTLCRWTTGDSDKKIVGVPSGTYCLVETSAPDGYVLAEKQTFKIESGKNPEKVIMYNKLNELHISKKSLTNKKVLPGAKLEIRDSGCKTVEKFCKDEKGNATSCVWESTDEEKVIFGVPSGTYCLVETVAPDGYVLSTEEVKFKIESGKNPKLVEMFNKLTSVQIYKLNEETGEPLKGAKLQIQDKDGKMLYEWISTEEPYEILGLKKGTYYLVEIEAPDGYEKYSGKIEFTIDGEEETVELELKNKPEYDVPDTLGGKSALLIAFAMFDIAIGIGIVLYVRKNKAQE